MTTLYIVKNKVLLLDDKGNLVPNIRISSLKTTNCVEIVEELRRYKIIFTNES